MAHKKEMAREKKKPQENDRIYNEKQAGGKRKKTNQVV
jgi:hypothetical protein